MTKVAVTGASGSLGRAILEALASHEQVSSIAVARTPSKVQGLKAEVRRGDYDDPSSLAEAFSGVDVVVLVSGNTAPEPRLKQHQQAIDAAKAAGVQRLSYTGILAEGTDSDFGGIQRMSLETEAYLKQSGLGWSIGQNGIYIEPDLEYIDKYVAAKKIWNSAGEGRCAYTNRAELAAAYARMATEPRYDGKVYKLTGEPITQSELVQLINKVFGTSLVYESLSVEDYRKDQKEALGEHMGTIIAGIYEGIRNGDFDVASDFAAVMDRPHQSPEQMMRTFQNSAKR